MVAFSSSLGAEVKIRLYLKNNRYFLKNKALLSHFKHPFRLTYPLYPPLHEESMF